MGHYELSQETPLIGDVVVPEDRGNWGKFFPTWGSGRRYVGIQGDPCVGSWEGRCGSGCSEDLILDVVKMNTCQYSRTDLQGPPI